jgi:hypothetical protein
MSYPQTTQPPIVGKMPTRHVMGRFVRRLLGSTSGVAVMEFAIVLPALLSLGLFGAEIAYMTTINMQVNQIAVSVADNASRLGQTDNTAVIPTVNETDIDSVMQGALHQGKNIRFAEQGRIILSSFERDSDTDRQFIHWQRCSGNLDKESAYGNDSDRNGLTGPEIAGLGSSGRVTVDAGMAVMFVEVFYEYDGIFADMFTDNMTFRSEAAFIVRDDRNLRDTGDPGITGTGGESHCT